jgi:short subunit dehydrogenase-like uncharacterized protein
MKNYDLVVIGATGATGREVVRYLSARISGDARWAIAGRDREKLERLAGRYGGRASVRLLDLGDHLGVDALVRETRVVLNVAGPFALLAEPVIRACAMHGVDYVDVTGETAHVRRMIDRYHDIARESGARIVPFCGFDSVPSDLGVLLLVEHFRRRDVGTRSVKGFVRATGGIGPGTLASTRALLRNPDDFDAMRDPELLSPSRPSGASEPDPATPVFDPDIATWVGPSPMGPINTRVVRRSAMLAELGGNSYGPGFRYAEFLDPGGALPMFAAGAAAWATAVYQLAGATPVGEALFSSWAATAAQPDANGSRFFRLRFVGVATDGTRAYADVAGFGDPATDVTATFVSESALTLAENDSRAGCVGILTPATALGSRLIDRLRSTGISFRLVSCRG